MRHRIAAQVVAVATIATASFACGTAEPQTDASTNLSPSAPVRPSPSLKSAELPPPVPLGKLPQEGVAVSISKSTVLVRLDGKVLSRLRGFSVAGNPGSAGVWLQRGRHYFSLDAVRGKLIPIARKVARKTIYEEGFEPDLPPPDEARVSGRIAGRWRYAYEDRGRTLAQWSGECEVPTAFWIEGSSPTIITGEGSLSDAPESIALGWSSSGDAVTLLGAGACGKAGDPPGIYIFDAPGSSTLVYETRRFASADMW